MVVRLRAGERVSNSSSGKSAGSQTVQGHSNFEKFLRQTHDDIEKGSAYTIPMQGLFDSAERRIDFLGQSGQKTNPIDSPIADAASAEASLLYRPSQAKAAELPQSVPKFHMANKTLGPLLHAAHLEPSTADMGQQSPSNRQRILPQPVQFVNPARIIHTDAKHKSAKQQNLLQSEADRESQEPPAAPQERGTLPIKSKSPAKMI